MNQVFLLQDNTRPHTGPSTSEATATMGWTVPPHPLYRPNLATSNFCLFGALKDKLPAQHFADDELKHGMPKSFRQYHICFNFTISTCTKLF
jgi:hypothetical protein